MLSQHINNFNFSAFSCKSSNPVLRILPPSLSQKKPIYGIATFSRSSSVGKAEGI